MNLIRLLVAAVVLMMNLAWSQQKPAADARWISREWTNLDGKKITAEFLGVQDSKVVLKLPNGKVSLIPILNLSTGDNSFIRTNGFDYFAPWQAWPLDAGITMNYAEIKEEPGDRGAFIYTTPHFRFHCDVNLGTSLMKDLGRIFELTFHLHSKSPFGILAKPEKDLFEAKLFGSLDAYKKAGGPIQSAGVYLPKDRVFLAPLELMGVRPGPTGWRKITDDYDPSTIVHELTHMLTHDMLDNLPTWANEGYAEYISSIPVEAKAFQTDSSRIKDGIRDTFVRDYIKSHSRPNTKQIELGKADRIKFLKGHLPPLNKVEKVLQMTDEEWATGHASSPARSGPAVPKTSFAPVDRNRIPRLYRTAHLIIYYFIQIEGEKGVLKIRRFLEENRKNLALYHQYLDDYKNFEAEMLAFMNLPGVTKLPDGRIQYPANLNFPKEPPPPFADVNALKLGGLGMLLDGEPAAAMGARIEKALVEDLEINLQFEAVPQDL